MTLKNTKLHWPLVGKNWASFIPLSGHTEEDSKFLQRFCKKNWAIPCPFVYFRSFQPKNKVFTTNYLMQKYTGFVLMTSQNLTYTLGPFPIIKFPA